MKSFAVVLLASAVSAQFGPIGNLVAGFTGGLANGLGAPFRGPPPPFGYGGPPGPGFYDPDGPGPLGPVAIGGPIDASTSPENPALAGFCIAQNTNTRNLTPNCKEFCRLRERRPWWC